MLNVRMQGNGIVDLEIWSAKGSEEYFLEDLWSSTGAPNNVFDIDGVTVIDLGQRLVLESAAPLFYRTEGLQRVEVKGGWIAFHRTPNGLTVELPRDGEVHTLEDNWSGMKLFV